jgi:hypothetical protein
MFFYIIICTAVGNLELECQTAVNTVKSRMFRDVCKRTLLDVHWDQCDRVPLPMEEGGD